MRSKMKVPSKSAVKDQLAKAEEVIKQALDSLNEGDDEHAKTLLSGYQSLPAVVATTIEEVTNGSVDAVAN